MTYDDLIVKEAGFVTGLLDEIKDQVNFKTKPFETIFSIMVTGYSWRLGWIIGGLVTAAQVLGYGPGEIGKLIDQYFFGQGAKTVNDIDLSKSNVAGAATSVAGTLGKMVDPAVNTVKDKLKSLFASNINDLRYIKGNITQNDKQAAFYVAAATICGPELIKTAKIGHLARLYRLWRRGNRMQVISGSLMKLVWMFAKGLLALGIGGGVASMVGLKPGKGPETTPAMQKDKSLFQPQPGEFGPGSKVPAHLKYYSNVSNDVKQTLHRFLDATIANFSTGFMQAQRLANPSKAPVPVERAPGWSKILSEVERYNWGPIAQVNKSKAFVAPRVRQIAQILLNSVGVSGIKIEKLEPHKDIPKTPSIKMPIGAKPPAGDEDRLRQLLTGGARI